MQTRQIHGNIKDVTILGDICSIKINIVLILHNNWNIEILAYLKPICQLRALSQNFQLLFLHVVLPNYPVQIMHARNIYLTCHRVPMDLPFNFNLRILVTGMLLNLILIHFI